MFGSLKNKLKTWVGKYKQDKDSEKSGKAGKKKIDKKKPKRKDKDKKQEKQKKTKKQEERKQKQVREKEELEEEDKEKQKKASEQERGEEDKEKQGFGLFKKKVTDERFEGMFDELEMILLQNNVAFEAVESIKKRLGEEMIGRNLSDVDIEKELRNALEEILINPKDLVKEIKISLNVRREENEKKPYVMIFAGINGGGKTTTIAKIAYLLQKSNLNVCLAAADTFRAASIEQLEQHGKRLNVKVIKKDYGADPASVGFDAIEYAKKNGIDVVLIDTAGRIQTQESLMREIEKICRVNKPDKKIFVAESVTGNDATEQARKFNETIDIDGIVLSKADVDEKGGAAISVSYVTKKPILYLGVGQDYGDLEIFDKEKLLKQLGL